MLALFLGLNARDASLLREANEHGAAKRYSEALTTSRRITRAPHDARAQVVQARALTLLGRVPEARKAWATAARRDPNNWQLQVEWGRLLLFTGDLDGAQRRFDRARELNPRLVP